MQFHDGTICVTDITHIASVQFLSLVYLSTLYPRVNICWGLSVPAYIYTDGYIASHYILRSFLR